MKFLRSIAADLVDKRLLPVVVVLVALAIAIPLGASVFSGGGSSKPAPVSPGRTISLPAGTPSPAKALEDVAGPNTPKAKHYTKPELNPFRASADVTTTAAKTTTAAVTSKSTAATPKTTTTTKTTTKTTPKKTTPAKVTTPKPVTSTPSTAGAPVAQLAKLRSVDSYAVDVRVQDATGLRNLADLERLSPVPSDTNALAEYLGVAKSGRAADFVLNKGTVVTGPGACLPSASNCQVVELKPGQIEALLASSAAGPIFQGIVTVTNWGVVGHSTPAAAATARRQESKTGRQLMLATPQPALDQLVYSVAQGVVSLLGNLGNTVAGLLNNGR
ncbi:MAG TPA: hypothetical protein VIJ51_00855 [Solirubrobacteraceae bacterium]